MFEDLEPACSDLNESQAHSLLQELERNRTEEIRRQRTHFRIAIKASVILQPGNASDRLAMKMKGVTGDLSQGGFGALFPLPPRVGDVYRAEFERSVLNLPTVYIRCLRCRLVRDDAFEAGFSFFAPIALPEELAADISV